MIPENEIIASGLMALTLLPRPILIRVARSSLMRLELKSIQTWLLRPMMIVSKTVSYYFLIEFAFDGIGFCERITIHHHNRIIIVRRNTILHGSLEYGGSSRMDVLVISFHTSSCIHELLYVASFVVLII